MKAVINLKELRKAKNISQQDVAEYLHITRAAYTNIENGKRETDFSGLSKLAKFFGVSTDYLLGLDPPPTQKEPATDNGDGLTDEERGYIKMYRSASPELQAAALGMLEAAEKARLARDSSAKDR